MRIGELIKSTRKGKRWTQSDLANAIGVDRSTIAKYESGMSEPSIDTIGKLSKALNRDLLSALGVINELTSASGNSNINLNSTRDAITHIVLELCINLNISFGTRGDIDDVDGQTFFYKSGEDEPFAQVSNTEIVALYDRLIEHGSIEFKALIDANKIDK